MCQKRFISNFYLITNSKTWLNQFFYSRESGNHITLKDYHFKNKKITRKEHSPEIKQSGK